MLTSLKTQIAQMWSSSADDPKEQRDGAYLDRPGPPEAGAGVSELEGGDGGALDISSPALPGLEVAEV